MSSGHPQGCVRWTEVKPGRSLVNALFSRWIGSLSRLVRTALLWILRRHIELARLLWILWWHIELTGLLRVLRWCIELARRWCELRSLELRRVLIGLLRVLRWCIELAICIDRRLCSEGHIYPDGCSNAGGLCLVPVPAT